MHYFSCTCGTSTECQITRGRNKRWRIGSLVGILNFSKGGGSKYCSIFQLFGLEQLLCGWFRSTVMSQKCSGQDISEQIIKGARLSPVDLEESNNVSGANRPLPKFVVLRMLPWLAFMDGNVGDF